MTQIPSIEDFESLQKELQDIKALLKIYGACLNMPKVVNIKDICSIERVSRSQITGKEAYLLPNFGKSEYPDGTIRWNLETYLEWRDIPIKTRKEMFYTYLDNQRRNYLKQAQ